MKAAWARRWWSLLSVAVQQAVLHLADPNGPSRLPLR